MRNKFLIQMTVFTGLFIFILLFNAEKAFVAKQLDLHKMMDVIQKNDGTISEWSLFAREELDTSLSVTDLEQTAKKWKQQFPQYKWEKQVDQNRWTLYGTSFNQDKQIEETLQLVADLNQNTLQGFVLYELKGTSWNSQVKKWTEQYSGSFLPEVFQETPMIFSNVKGNFSQSAASTAKEKALELNQAFNGKLIETLTEEHFVSLTTNSSYFENQIQSVKGSFNMQIAVRSGELDENSTFVIGTPILTIEY